VASATLLQDLDLKKIGDSGPNVEYNPKRFAPCVMRLRNPKSTCLIFSSGRMIVSGCKSEAECKLALRKYAKIIQRCCDLEPITVSILNFEIQNISANAQLKFPVSLKKMAEDLSCKQFARLADAFNLYITDEHSYVGCPMIYICKN
jgi:transcription initiation factor TFIID TATA-box-binding protein